jgi:hypothetical protein
MVSKKKGTISTNFQELAHKGYIITTPDNDGYSEYDLRNVTVVNIEKWVCKDEYLQSTNFKESELIPMSIENSKWKQTKFNSKKRKESNPIENENTETNSIVNTHKIEEVKETFSNEIEITYNQNEETEQTHLTESTDYINLDEFLNDNKRKAFEKYFQSELFRQNGITDFEKLKSKKLTEDNLKTILNFQNGVYYLLNFDEHKELLYENLNNLSFSCLVNGSVGKLTHYNSDTETTDTIRISEKKIDKYLDENEIEFKDLKYKDFIRLKNESIKLSETF